MLPTIPTPGRRGVARCLAALCGALGCALALAGPALAQDASLDQVYQASHAGRIEQALQMMDPVLRDHPDSAKAHYVEAELLAQQGRLGPAQTELATAERLAPGLPFVQDAALQHLHRVLDAQPAAVLHQRLSMPRAEAATGRPLAWGLLLAVAFGALLGWLLTRASRPRAVVPVPAVGLAGPAMGWQRTAPGAAVPWGGAPAATAPGWGSQVAGGLAGGLAAGAAVVAGQELGRHLFGHDTGATPAAAMPGSPTVVDQTAAPDAWDDPDFGIRDAGDGWDDGPDAGGLGGNWDV